jgi:hypothetical protein
MSVETGLGDQHSDWGLGHYQETMKVNARSAEILTRFLAGDEEHLG